jgi:Flp pilus assembly protein TadD
MPVPRALLLAIALAVMLPRHAFAQANEPPPPLPPEYSQASRNAFAAGMKEARTLLAQKQYEAAIARLDSLTRDRPREPQARFLKGVALTALGRDDEATKQFEALTSDFPELPEPHNNLAALYAKKGDLALARRELELAIAADPDYGIANENLGDVYVRLAAQQYERAGALAKNSKTLPLKLKLVRDVLTATPADAASATPPTTGAASTEAKPDAAPPPRAATPGSATSADTNTHAATKEKSP